MGNNVLLVDPLWKFGQYESPNIKLGYSAAILNQGGYKCEILDFIDKEAVKAKTYNDFTVYRNKFYDKICKSATDSFLIYFNCEYGMLHTCLEVATILKKIKSDLKICVGGTFINYLLMANCLEEILERVQVIDFIVLGDVEIGIKELCDLILTGDYSQLENIKGVYKYQSRFIQNLDELPFPQWSHYNMNLYDGQLYLLAARGCRYNQCTFCDERLIWGNDYRSRSYDSLIEEIKSNITNYGINSFFFWDASITSYPNLKDFCKEIIKQEIKCKWVGLARVTEIDEETISLMKKAGCVGIEVGIETANEDILRDMQKNITLKKVKETIEILRKHELFTEGSFMIGYPGETAESVKKTIEFAQELHLDYYRWHNFQASHLYLKKNAEEINEDWATLDLNVPNHLVSNQIVGRPGGYLDMHIVAKMGDNFPQSYPELRIGELNIEEIHSLTRQAILGTAQLIDVEGHNPYI